MRLLKQMIIFVSLINIILCETHDVSIINMTFSPNSIQIAIGDTVRWTNLDSTPHTATATSGEWNSGNMNLNDEYSHVFLIEEVHPYYCIYHSNMTGSVTVGNPETEESQWELIESGINVPINDIFFVSEALGWCGSDMGILKTEDEGSNWNISSTSDDVEAIYFINSTEGWACGNDGMILHTSNGGNTWVSQSSGTDEKLRDIRMADENNGWAVGRDGLLLHTTNGGQNWVFQNNPAPDDLRGIAIESASIAWVVGSDGIIMHTVDGGESWNIQSIGTDEIELESVFFLNDQLGWACGETGAILKTANGGNSWVYQNSGVAVELTDIYFVDSSLGWSVGLSGTILFTEDGGNNWETMNGGTYATLNSVYFLNNEIGFSAGSEGVIIKYSNSESEALVPELSILSPLEGQTFTSNEIDITLSGENLNEGDHYHVYVNDIFDGDYTAESFTILTTGTGSFSISAIVASESQDEYTNPEASDTVNIIIEETGYTVDYLADIQPIFNDNCTSCHGGSGGLDLSEGVSYDNLVNVASQGYAPSLRVEPGSAANSVLWNKVAGTGLLGAQMPLGGSPLSQTDINTIEIWINEGANENQLSLFYGNNFPPNEVSIINNYPNPFNPITSIEYSLMKQSRVKLIIYDMFGREVTQLVNTTQEAGFKSVQWNATDSFGKPVSAGVYLYQIRAGEFVQTKKMVLLK
jgi:photosystem II stability/assembly factor-like uncharacterized protein